MAKKSAQSAGLPLEGETRAKRGWGCAKREPPAPQGSREGFGADPKPYYLAFGLLAVLELVRRGFLGYVPDDFTAYLSAADAFVAGLNPYTDELFTVARYNGKPYNYFPGTLYLIAPLGYLPTAVAAAVDWVMRMVVLVATLRFLHRRILPEVGFQFVLVVAALSEPLMIDLLFGNSVTYLLGAWALSVWLSEQPKTRPAHYGLAALVGLVTVFKPFWFLPAAWSLFVGRKWGPLAAAVGSIGSVTAASLTLPETIPAFFAHTQRMREFYYSVDFLNLAPWLLPVVGVAWGAAALWLDRKGDRDWVFLWGCASIPLWPRLATYSYTMTIPIVLYLVRRWGWARGLAYSCIVIGPIPWLLRVSPLMPGERLELWAHFIWTIVTSVVLFRLLSRKAGRP